MPRTLNVLGRYDRLEQICNFVAEAAEQAGLDDAASNRCQLAVDEACTNIIEHGYGGENHGQIEITTEAGPGELTILIKDWARPFDPGSVPDPKLNASVEEMGIGGLGLYFMRQVMDEVEFSQHDGGNQIRLVKRVKNE